MKRITLPNEYSPRRYQCGAMAYFDTGGKRAIDVWHRRAGKDITALHQTCKMAHERVAVYWHFFPTLEQGRKAIWEGITKDGRRIINWVFPPALVARRNEQQMMIEFKCGSIWRLMGTDKMESVGAGPAGVVFSEFSLCRPSAWDFVRPMLRENGGWAWFIFTPRGRNHAKKLLDANKDKPGWRVAIHSVRDTGLTYSSSDGTDRLLSPDEMMAEERAEGMAEEMVRQEYLCDFDATNVGSVWGAQVEELEKRGGLAEFEHPSDGVFTTWDLGISDAVAIWWWRLNEHGMPDVIDYYEKNGMPLSHFFDVVDQRSYRYVKHWLPHDARARTLQTGVSTFDMFVEKWSAGAVAIGPELSLADGLQAARWLLQQPMRIHPRCSEGIECLRSYHYAWDQDRKVFSSKPEHDWSSHGADAFRYLALVAKYSELMTRKPAAKPSPPVAVPIDRSFTLDQLFEDRARMRRG